MGLIEFITELEQFGFFTYIYPFLISYIIFFVLLFLTINKIKFLSDNKPLKALINLIISSFISYIIAMMLLSFSIIPTLIQLILSLKFGFILHIIIFAFIIFSGVLWIIMLIDAIRKDFEKSNEKVIWILVIIFGGLMGGYIFYFLQKFIKT